MILNRPAWICPRWPHWTWAPTTRWRLRCHIWVSSKCSRSILQGSSYILIWYWYLANADSSGVPKTVFKGNQRNYAKECVLIIDKTTGEVTLERLHHNIQVKKTRSESSKAPALPLGGGGGGSGAKITLENSTQRTVSKTKVSTGYRKSGLGALSGIVQRHSPIQGSPSYPLHKSPQQAPA